MPTWGDEGMAGRRARARAVDTWNGRDWSFTFGENGPCRDWDDAVRYGFVSGGGGRWYSLSIRTVPVGARVFVLIPTRGYVGVGIVTAEATTFDETTVEVDGRAVPLAEQELAGRYRHSPDVAESDEYILPLRWLETREREHAVWERGMFAHQGCACRFRHQPTLSELVARFGLDD